MKGTILRYKRERITGRVQVGQLYRNHMSGRICVATVVDPEGNFVTLMPYGHLIYGQLTRSNAARPAHTHWLNGAGECVQSPSDPRVMYFPITIVEVIGAWQS